MILWIKAHGLDEAKKWDKAVDSANEKMRRSAGATDSARKMMAGFEAQEKKTAASSKTLSAELDKVEKSGKSAASGVKEVGDSAESSGGKVSVFRKAINSLKARFRGTGEEAKGFGKIMESVKRTLIRAGAVFAAFMIGRAIGGAIMELGRRAIEIENTFYRLERRVKATNETFGQTTDIDKYKASIAAMSDSLKIYSERQLADATIKIMQMTQELGVSADSVLELTRATAELAAVNREDFEPTAQSLSLALAGQTRAARRLGLDLTADVVAAEALAAGMTKSVTAMTNSERAQLRVAATLRQVASLSGTAAGSIETVWGAQQQFNKELDEFAEKQNIIKNTWEAMVRGATDYLVEINKITSAREEEEEREKKIILAMLEEGKAREEIARALTAQDSNFLAHFVNMEIHRELVDEVTEALEAEAVALEKVKRAFAMPMGGDPMGMMAPFGGAIDGAEMSSIITDEELFLYKLRETYDTKQDLIEAQEEWNDLVEQGTLTAIGLFGELNAVTLAGVEALAAYELQVASIEASFAKRIAAVESRYESAVERAGAGGGGGGGGVDRAAQQQRRLERMTEDHYKKLQRLKEDHERRINDILQEQTMRGDLIRKQQEEEARAALAAAQEGGDPAKIREAEQRLGYIQYRRFLKGDYQREEQARKEKESYETRQQREIDDYNTRYQRAEEDFQNQQSAGAARAGVNLARLRKEADDRIEELKKEEQDKKDLAEAAFVTAQGKRDTEAGIILEKLGFLYDEETGQYVQYKISLEDQLAIAQGKMTMAEGVYNSDRKTTRAATYGVEKTDTQVQGEELLKIQEESWGLENEAFYDKMHDKAKILDMWLNKYGEMIALANANLPTVQIPIEMEWPTGELDADGKPIFYTIRSGRGLEEWVEENFIGSLPAPSGQLGPGGKYGLNMIVPPGYPDDSFPIRASSGERVLIIPEHFGAGGGASGPTYNYTTYYQNQFKMGGVSMRNEASVYGFADRLARRARMSRDYRGR